MGNFNNRGGYGGNRGGGKFGGRNSGGNRGGGRNFNNRRDDRGSVQMHRAVCNDCGNNCELPFRPTGEKPVFCSDCFENKGGRDSGGNRRGGRDFGNKNPRLDSRDRRSAPSVRNYKVQFEQLNAKLDKVLKMLDSESTERVKIVKARNPKKEIDTDAIKEVVADMLKKKPKAKKKVVKKVLPKKTTSKKKSK